MNNEDLATAFKTANENLHELEQEEIHAPLVLDSLTIHHAYYRSKLFSITTQVNPLLNAASPLFALANSLSHLEGTPPLVHLQHELTHEIKAFENKAQQQHYERSIILAARYILCCFLDEMIQNTAWGKRSDWQQQTLLSIFQHENWGGDKFFAILQRASSDPLAHIDLLELIYICLSLGYEGMYRQQERGHVKLAALRDELFELIQLNRGETIALQLHQTAAPIAQPAIKQMKMYGIISVISLILMLSIYFGFNTLLEHHATHLYQQLQQLQ